MVLPKSFFVFPLRYTKCLRSGDIALKDYTRAHRSAKKTEHAVVYSRASSWWCNDVEKHHVPRTTAFFFRAVSTNKQEDDCEHTFKNEMILSGRTLKGVVALEEL